MPATTSFLKAIVGLATLSRVTEGSTIPASNNASWPSQKFVSAPFTPPSLQITRATSPTEGYYFLAPDGPGAAQTSPLIMDVTGQLVWNGPNEHAFGFGVQKYRGQNVLVSWNGTLFPEPLGRGYGAITLLNNHYETIANVTLHGNFITNTPGAKFPSYIDVHENYITSRNTILVTAHNTTRADLSSVGGPKAGWVVDNQVYEIDIATGKVLFSWKSLDHLSKLPFKSSLNKLGTEGFNGKTQTTAWDYFHINSVGPYNDGFVINSRYLCSAIAVNRQGVVQWHLQGVTGGDFKLGPGADFCFEHQVRAIPPYTTNNGTQATLYMHDNHNSPFQNGSVPSTGKILDVNLDAKLATLQRRFVNGSNPVFSTFTGGISKLSNGNVLVDHGSVPVLEEYSAAGKILSTVQFGATQKFPRGVITAERATLSYRASKQSWVGCPRTDPSLVIRDPSGNLSDVTLYMSWNGATQVNGWRIFSGIESPSFTETVNATGFETVVGLPFIEFAQIYPVFENGTPPDCGQNATSGLVFVPGVVDRKRSVVSELMGRLDRTERSL